LHKHEGGNRNRELPAGVYPGTRVLAGVGSSPLWNLVG